MMRLWPVAASTMMAAAVACLAVSSSSAQQGEGETASGLAAVPVCVNNKDEAVRFVNRNRGRAELAVGMATRDVDGVPMVVRSNFAAAPVEFQQFIDRHECAHHQTGDVDRPHPPRNSPEHLMIESIADCVAIRRLRDEEGFDSASVEVIASALRTDMKKIGFPEISVTSRIRNISGCFANPSSAGDLVDQVLRQRGLRQ